MEQKLQLNISMKNRKEEEEEFYEEIEAPKFVDFTHPDHFSPDDRFWFCSRVGCNQEHEKEMDSEAIYKNFVLRVMVARSPNVRFRRAISRDPSESKKCPFSAPPKSSKSRLPRLALVSSSICKKLIINEESGKKVKALPTNVKPVSTPKARVKHVAAKYMTSPRKQKGSSPGAKILRSVRNPKKTSISLPKSKVVAKALAFNSPKKALEKKKKAQELGTPMTRLCDGVKKLHINSQKKGIIAHKPSKDCTSEIKKLPLDGLRKITSSHKVKTQEVEAQSCKFVKDKAKTNVKRKHNADAVLLDLDKNEDQSSDMELDEKSRCGSLESGSAILKLSSGEASVVKHSEETSSSERPMTGEGSDTVSLNTQKNEIHSGPECDDKLSAEEDSVARQAPAGEQCQEKGYTIADNNNANVEASVVKHSEETSSSERPMIVIGSDTVSLNTQKNEIHSGPECDGKLSAEEVSVARQAPADEQCQEKGNTIADDLENQKSGVVTQLEDSDDKENALNSAEIRNMNIDNLSKHDVPVKTKVKTKKNPSKLDKTSEENCPAGTNTHGLKNRKLKPTNPKPFRLRTDERGILREATLERKVNSLENASSASENSQGTGNGVSDKGSKKDESKSLKKDQLRPIKSKYKTLTEVEPKSEKSSTKGRSPFLQRQLVGPPRGIVSRVKTRELEAIQEAETTILGPKESKKLGKEVVCPTNKASVVQKSATRGKRPATIPREPNFHSSHKPKGCTRTKP